MSDSTLPSRLPVNIDGEREIFMSFGLLNELAGMVGAIERIAAIDLDPVLAIATLEACLVPRDEKGRREKDYALPGDLEPEAAEAILDWAKGHVLSFFIRRLRKNVDLLEGNKASLGAIGSSLIGLDPSASKTVSSSPSA